MKLHFTADYDGLVKKLLFANQPFDPHLRICANGIPTIGYNFNLKSDALLFPVLCAMGFDVHGKYLDRPAWLGEKYYINLIKNVLCHADKNSQQSILSDINKILLERKADKRYDKFSEFKRTTAFKIKENRIIPFLQSIIENIENVVDEWLTAFEADLIQSNVQLIARNTRERAVLVSLAFQGAICINEGNQPTFQEFADALVNDNRALAWFLIRYDKTTCALDTIEVVKQRYLESELFGLYDEGTNEITITREKCGQIYEMFNEHKEVIIQHERNYCGVLSKLSESFRQYGITSVKSLEQSFKIAYEFVRNTARLQSSLKRTPTLIDRVQDKDNSCSDFKLTYSTKMVS